MARKKAEIQADWDKATTALDLAIKNANTVNAAKVADVEQKYKKWKTLLTEAVNKVGRWEGEQADARLVFQKHVNTQKEKTDVRYQDAVTDLQAALKASDEYTQIVTEAARAIPAIKKRLEGAADLLKQGKAEDAMHEIGGVETGIKNNLAFYATLAGLKKQAVNTAKKHKADVAHFDFTRTDLQTPFKLIVAACQEIPKAAHALSLRAEDELDKAAQKDPVSANQDPNYQKNMKRIYGEYKNVIETVKAGLAKMRDGATRIAKIQELVKTATPDKVANLAAAVVKLDTFIAQEREKLQQLFQDTLRTGESKFAKQAKEQIADEDRKGLKAFIDRGITFSLQASNLYNSSHEDLVEVLESLVERFPNSEAKKALGQVAA